MNCKRLVWTFSVVVSWFSFLIPMQMCRGLCSCWIWTFSILRFSSLLFKLSEGTPEVWFQLPVGLVSASSSKYLWSTNFFDSRAVQSNHLDFKFSLFILQYFPHFYSLHFLTVLHKISDKNTIMQNWLRRVTRQANCTVRTKHSDTIFTEWQYLHF